MTASDDDFQSLIQSAYAEPMMITGAVGDDDLTAMAPTPQRDGTDLGVAGSLDQTRRRLKFERRHELGPPLSDRITVTAVAVLIGCAFGVGVLVTGALPLQVAVLIGVLLLAGAAGSAWMLAVRYGPTRGERNLALTIDAENRAGRELADAVAGSSWVLFHDRRLSARRASGVVHRRWSGGNSVDRDLPAGPYLILAPSGVKAGEDELAYGWLPARVWEARYLMRQLSNVGTAGLRFAGPVMPMAMEGYPRASKIPDGWSAQPPYRIDQFPIRRPAVLGQYLSYLPRIFAPHHVAQLAQLVDQHCPPAPEAPSATTSV